MHTILCHWIMWCEDPINCQVFWVSTNFCNNFILIKYLNMLDAWILVDVLFLTPLCLVHWRVSCYKATTTPNVELNCTIGMVEDGCLSSQSQGHGSHQHECLQQTWALYCKSMLTEWGSLRNHCLLAEASFRLVTAILLILDICSWIIDLLCLNLMQVKVLCLITYFS